MYLNYLQPWKLFSLVCGIALLIGGSFYYTAADDWTIANSLSMGIAAYLLAPLAYKFARQDGFLGILMALALCWLTVDTTYITTNWLTDAPTYRIGNLYASPLLFAACAIVWGQDGTLRQVLEGLRRG